MLSLQARARRNQEQADDATQRAQEHYEAGEPAAQAAIAASEQEIQQAIVEGAMVDIDDVLHPPTVHPVHGSTTEDRLEFQQYLAKHRRYESDGYPE